MKGEVAIISAVRDFAMYERCVSGNAFCAGCRIVTMDNRKENLPVTLLYNRAARGLLEEGFSGWMVFCHEDWQVEESLSSALEKLDGDALYGVVGVDVWSCRRADVMVVKGSVYQGSRKGDGKYLFRGKETQGSVGTFDCQCIIVHSSLLSDKGLRFDENLSFDMYVEDFCAMAYERYGIGSHVIPLSSTHWSEGRISAGFREALSYVKRKYKGASKRYASIAGHKNCFGAGEGRPLLKWKDKPWNAFVRFLYGIG